MDSPLISVILPTYNGSRYIREAIDSVLVQNYKNWELIIIDDASTDDTQAILAEYIKKDSRIKTFRNERNIKLVESLNRGIELAQGKYIARLDDDDIWRDTSKLSKQIQCFQENPKLGIVGTFATTIDENGCILGKIIHASSSNQVKRGFGLKNQLIHTSILARKDVIINAGRYQKEWLYVEDFDLWLRVLALGYEIENIPEEMVEYRIRQGNTTAKKYHRMQWLTFLRLFQDKYIYAHNTFRRLYCLGVRLTLVVIPIWIMNSLK